MEAALIQEYGIIGFVLAFFASTLGLLIRYLLKKFEEERKYYRDRISEVSEKHEATIKSLHDRHDRTLESMSSHHDSVVKTVVKDTLAVHEAHIKSIIDELKEIKKDIIEIRKPS